MIKVTNVKGAVIGYIRLDGDGAWRFSRSVGGRWFLSESKENALHTLLELYRLATALSGQSGY